MDENAGMQIQPDSFVAFFYALKAESPFQDKRN